MIAELICGIISLFVAVFFFWYRKLPIYRIGDFPTPPSVFLLGHAPYINSTKKILGYFNEQLLKNNGIFKLTVGTKALLVVSNYEFIEWIMNSTTIITKSEEYEYLQTWLGQGLLLATGSHWKAHRKILTPAFHFQMIEKHINALNNVGKVLLEKLEKNVEQDSLDIFPIISSFALDAVCESSMAISVNAQEKGDSDYCNAVRHICRILISRSFDPFKMFNIFFQFHEDHKIFEDSIKIIHDFDNSVIKERREMLQGIVKEDLEDAFASKKRTPFLDILLTARDQNNQPLTDKEIREEVDTIMFAGHETTASAISFVLYNIANHPNVQERLVEEQMEMFGNDINPTFTYSNLNDMKYLDMVIKESLRLYPSVPFIGRKITEDTYYTDGKLLPKDLTLTIVLFSLHRNPQLFPDPEKFDPSRFEANAKKSAYSFLPFSAGPRNCIGQKFAMIEIKQIVSAILRNFELLPAIPHHTIELSAETSLKSANGIRIKFKKRVY